MDKPYAIRNKETGKLLDIDGATWLPKEAIVEYYDTFVDHSKCEIVTIYVAPIGSCWWCDGEYRNYQMQTLNQSFCGHCGRRLT